MGVFVRLTCESCNWKSVMFYLGTNPQFRESITEALAHLNEKEKLTFNTIKESDKSYSLLNYDALFLCEKCGKFYNKTVVTLDGIQQNSITCDNCGEAIKEFDEEKANNINCLGCGSIGIRIQQVDGIID